MKLNTKADEENGRCEVGHLARLILYIAGRQATMQYPYKSQWQLSYTYQTAVKIGNWTVKAFLCFITSSFSLCTCRLVISVAHYLTLNV